MRGRSGDVAVSTDEQPRKADAAKIATLKPAFAKDGTVTAVVDSLEWLTADLRAVEVRLPETGESCLILAEPLRTWPVVKEGAGR